MWSLLTLELANPRCFVEAKRTGLLPLVRPMLDALLARGFRLDRKLYDQIVKGVKEE